MERKFNCKNEELPVIAGYVSSNLKRDLDRFTAFSPRFDQTYVETFENQIAEIEEIVTPKQETLELKQITARLYATIDGLVHPADLIEGYLKLGKSEIGVSAKDFGTTALKDNLRRKDVEAILNSLQIVNANVGKYKAALTTLGLSEATAKQFTDGAVNIRQDNLLQYEITSRRKNLVVQHTDRLNRLYDQIIEICETGKALFGKTDKVKASGYMFSYLIKSVRAVHKTNKANEN